jgi:hypothetical protein
MGTGAGGSGNTTGGSTGTAGDVSAGGVAGAPLGTLAQLLARMAITQTAIASGTLICI